MDDRAVYGRYEMLRSGEQLYNNFNSFSIAQLGTAQIRTHILYVREESEMALVY
jgi:hypothetical protein